MTGIHRTVQSHSLLAVTTLLVLATASCAPALSELIPTLAVPSATATDLPTLPPSPTASNSSTFTLTPTFTETPTFTVTPTFTITPTFTLTPTSSRTPTLTRTPAPPIVSILNDHTACNFGPGDAYLYKYGLMATAWMQVIGQIQDGSWLLIDVQSYYKVKNPCWIKTSQVRFNDGGDVTTHNIPVVDPDIILYFSTTHFYRPPQGVTSIRVGSKVNVYWNAVWMTEDDFYGYLIEAWVCQGGQQVFRTYNPFPRESVRHNVGLQSMQIPDEPGCQLPSHARIYTQEKHGVTGYVGIPWPDYRDPTPRPTRTATP